MKNIIAIIIACLLPSVAFSQADLTNELHKGSVAIDFASFDGNSNIGVRSYSYDGTSTTFGGHYFIDETIRVGLARGSGSYKFGPDFGNFECDWDGTSVSVSVHPQRTNIITGVGDGYSFGFINSNVESECEDDDFYYEKISSDTDSLSIAVTRGLKNGIVFLAGFSSDVDDFLDDRTFSFGLSQAHEGNLVIRAGISFGETAEDKAGNNAEFADFSFGVASYF